MPQPATQQDGPKVLHVGVTVMCDQCGHVFHMTSTEYENNEPCENCSTGPVTPVGDLDLEDYPIGSGEAIETIVESIARKYEAELQDSYLTIERGGPTSQAPGYRLALIHPNHNRSEINPAFNDRDEFIAFLRGLQTDAREIETKSETAEVEA